MSDFKDNTIHMCVHCTTQTSGKYCKNCDTAEKRKSMDADNKKINPAYVCRVCDLGHYSTFVVRREELTIPKMK